MFINKRMAGVLCVVMTALLMMAADAYAQQRGKASYYSRRANGARTSSGIRLNNDSLVCAHKTHPFGSKLLVRNPANGKEVVVTVIDRGPHIRGRIIDLSHEAARRLGILAAGVAMVEVEEYDDIVVPYDAKQREKPEIDLELPVSGEGGAIPDWQKKE
jgi:rare lipoprotein A